MHSCIKPNLVWVLRTTCADRWTPFVYIFLLTWAQNNTVHFCTANILFNLESQGMLILNSPTAPRTFFEGLASWTGESSKPLIDSQGSSIRSHLTAKLSNAAQMASNILLKVIIHFNAAAASLEEGCSSPSFLWTLKSYLRPTLTHNNLLCILNLWWRTGPLLTSKLNKGESTLYWAIL